MCFYHSVLARQLRQFWVGGDVNHFNDLNLSGVLRIHKPLASLFDFLPVSPVRHAWSLIALIPLSLPPLGTKAPDETGLHCCSLRLPFSTRIPESPWAEQNCGTGFQKKNHSAWGGPGMLPSPGVPASPWGKAVPRGPLFLPHLSQYRVQRLWV